ncbi:DNA topoisomerase IB [Kordia algicida OT-1]|uniref:DNA topoisomerase IB n=1 Tax=Kordia algicida OT-1 TaxID=391587 RepID=A9DPS9_9FLAO|nr:DNA topoisomerase IB [Kordia algicida]EDP97511.1 DNA topoisomerase IB [Kordia algicida OT-1]
MKIHTLNKEFIKALRTQPEQVIDIYNLTYTTPEILNIKRKRVQENFVYEHNGKPITKASDLKRLESLVIPPAWQKVRIACLENAHLQATGRDEKNRKQYRYHPKWQKIKNQTKFFKMIAFAEALPKLRMRVQKDLEQKKWTRTKVLAIVIRLLEESHIRIGNAYYAKKNSTYGLSTMRTRHINIYKEKFTLQYVGKRGKEHKVTIKNKKLTRLLNKCEEIPGWELFQYYDEYGGKHAIDSTMVNEYIHSLCGDIFSAKDFRTWAASLIFFDTLKNAPKSDDAKVKEKQILHGIDAAAEALNNTRTVCRKYYVHPVIAERFLDEKLQPYFDMVDNLPKSVETELQPNEKALKALLETYTPNFNKSLAL